MAYKGDVEKESQDLLVSVPVTGDCTDSRTSTGEDNGVQIAEKSSHVGFPPPPCSLEVLCTDGPYSADQPPKGRLNIAILYLSGRAGCVVDLQALNVPALTAFQWPRWVGSPWLFIQI